MLTGSGSQRNEAQSRTFQSKNVHHFCFTAESRLFCCEEEFQGFKDAPRNKVYKEIQKIIHIFHQGSAVHDRKERSSETRVGARETFS